MNQHSTTSAISAQGNYKNVSEQQVELAETTQNNNSNSWPVYWDSYAEKVVQLIEKPFRLGQVETVQLVLEKIQRVGQDGNSRY